jgi:hypothetical protein
MHTHHGWDRVSQTGVFGILQLQVLIGGLDL